MAARNIKMLEGSGERKGTADRADVRTWNLAYASVSPSGTVTIDATAAAAPIVDELTFAPSSSTPKSKLSCR